MHQKKEYQDEEIIKQQAQCEEYLNGWKRALADYENLKKQTQKEKEEFVKFATLNFLISLMPIYDHLKLSFNHLPESLKDNSWVKGIEQIKNQMQEVLKFNGVEEIEPKIGDDFNPEIHEAVAEPTDDNLETEINSQEAASSENKENKSLKIKQVLGDGYKLYGHVFKPARVVVE